MPASSVRIEGLEVQFQSAVNLIRSLPKEGQFQPSYDDASKVYGYYKQAQLGPCNQPKPGFWDVVGRAKWNAWSQLGDMSKDEAMKCYVIEIKRLFEKLSASEEFQEQQKDLSVTIIPFCEATGLQVPISIKEDNEEEKTVAKKSKVGDKLDMNGYANGHHHWLDSLDNHKSPELLKNETLGVVINGKDIQILKNSPIEEKKDYKHETSDYSKRKSSSMERFMVEADTDQIKDAILDDSVVSINTEINCKETTVPKNGATTMDTDSSDDDDIYCDSFNPDAVSGFISFNSSTSNVTEREDTANIDLTCVTNDLSLAETPSPCGKNDVAIRLHSTPYFKKNSPSHQYSDVKNSALNDADSNSCSAFEIKDASNFESSEREPSINVSEDITDISASSSNSNSEMMTSSGSKNGRVEIEDELCREFAKHVSKNNAVGSSGHRVLHEASSTSSGTVKKQHDVTKDHQLAISARGGGSQGDLASSGSKSDSRSRSQAGDNKEMREASSTEQAAKLRPRRSKRGNSDSSSDSDAQSVSSQVKGETIGEQIVKALHKMEQDMQMVLLRLNSIEESIRATNQANQRNFWTEYLPSRRMLLLLLWPVVINIIFAYWRRRVRK